MGGATILIVDDEPAIVAFIATVLRNRGYIVLEASDGFTALKCAALHSGPIDLLLTDLHMPGLMGTQLCERLRSQRPEARYLLMSGDTIGIEASGLPFLAKPFRVPDLLHSVQQILEASSDQLPDPVR